jgi:hypothetical protein
MAEILPDLLSAFDARKRAVVKQLASALADPSGAMTQLLAQRQEDVGSRNAATRDALAGGDWAGVTAQANQGIAPAPIPVAGGVPGLAAYQLPVYRRLLAATGDHELALQQTLKMTNLMSDVPGSTAGLIKPPGSL